jgi:Cu/Ag efflux protein CusF
VRITTAIILAGVFQFLSGSGNAVRAQAAKGEQGIDVVDVEKASAVVKKLDLKTRKLTLEFDDHKSKTVKVDKSYANLDQLKVGDKLNLTYIDEMVISVGKSGLPPGAAAAGAVGVTAKGSNRGIVMADTVDIRAKVLSVDPNKDRLTLEEPDRKKKTIKVSKNA